MFGLVDYEDEEDDIPMNNLGSNGKDDGGGKVLEKTESDSLLTSIPLSDPIWSNLEDATVAKRKSPPTPDLEQQNDAVLLKRQKPQGAIERSSDVQGTLISIDDSEELAFSTRNAEVPAELLTKRPDTDTSQIEEPKPASENGTVVSVPESNHIVGGDGAEDLSCPNGKVNNTLSSDTDCPNRIANGSTDSGDGEVAISSGGHEDPNVHNGIRGGDGNGVNSDDNGIGQDCNGVKCKVTSELSNGSSLESSENKQKMTSLSTTEHHRAVTPTSPGPFTVR